MVAYKLTNDMILQNTQLKFCNQMIMILDVNIGSQKGRCPK